jgi:hypothetical protein
MLKNGETEVPSNCQRTVPLVSTLAALPGACACRSFTACCDLGDDRPTYCALASKQ